MDYGYMMGCGGIGMFGMFIFLIALIGIPVYLISKSRQRTGDNAVDIIKKRYARGDIDKEEMKELLKNL